MPPHTSQLSRHEVASFLECNTPYLNGREILFNGQSFNSDFLNSRLNFPIVLLRGLGRSSGFWLGFGDNLSTHSRVVMLDLKGTGRSQNGRSQKSSTSFASYFRELNWGRGSVAEHAQDVANTLRHLGIEKCHLVGISFGGMVAASVANICKLESLTVIASSARFTKESRIHKTAIWKLLREFLHSYPRHHVLGKYLVSAKYLDENAEIISRWDELCKTEGFQRLPVFRQLLSAGLLNGQKEFSSIQCSALFVVSRHDGLVDWRNTPVLWQSSANSKLLYLEGFGHDIPTEAPYFLAQKLVDYMDKVEKKHKL